MWKLILALIGGALLLSFYFFWRSRRQSIVGTKSRNKYFARLAKRLNFTQGGDPYFIQLQGLWRGTSILIYPHNFEGPGSITLFYADTGVPFQERTWIEPTLSLGRAIVEWKRQIPFHFEISGEPAFPKKEVLSALDRYKKQFPFIAITLPARFIFSHYLMESLRSCPNFIVLLVLDAGRKPEQKQIEQAMDAAVDLCAIVRKTSTNQTP